MIITPRLTQLADDVAAAVAEQEKRNRDLQTARRAHENAERAAHNATLTLLEEAAETGNAANCLYALNHVKGLGSGWVEGPRSGYTPLLECEGIVYEHVALFYPAVVREQLTVYFGRETAHPYQEGILYVLPPTVDETLLSQLDDSTVTQILASYTHVVEFMRTVYTDLPDTMNSWLADIYAVSMTFTADDITELTLFDGSEHHPEGETRIPLPAEAAPHSRRSAYEMYCATMKSVTW